MSEQELYLVLEQRFGSSCEVETFEDGSVELTSESSGLELRCRIEDAQLVAELELYVLAPGPTGQIGHDEGSAEISELRPRYRPQVLALFDELWREAGWELGEPERWFTAASEEDGEDDLLGYEIPIRRVFSGIETLTPVLAASLERDNWRLFSAL